MLARLATILSPVTLYLALAVAVFAPLSGWLGWRLAVSGIECRAERAQEIAVATEQGKTQALAEAAERSAQIAEQERTDAVALLTDLQAIAERARVTQVVYRDRVKTLPAATCAPGAERVAAANALIAGEAE